MLNDQIAIAVNLLLQGKPIIFPTDTVYGLGADARCEQAILSIFELKNRPAIQALPVLLPDISHIYTWADQENLNKYSLNKKLFNLIGHFWPGPLTIVVKKAKTVSNILTANNDTVAIRIPNNPIILKLLKNFNSGIVGTSANKSGSPSAKTAQEAKDQFGEKIFVLDGGTCSIGVESTIISLVDVPTILREGAISAEQLLRLCK